MTEALAATGYDGPLSLEIFNDQFRAGSARSVAVDGHRSLLFLLDQLATRNKALVPAITKLPPRSKALGTEFVEFGPKRSLHLIGADTPDYDYAAMKAAYDISMYDQQACFSPQETFIEGEPRQYVNALARWLDKNLTRIAKAPVDKDMMAHITRARSEAKFRGWQVFTSKGTEWTIIVTDEPCLIDSHPLSRTIYVHPVKHLEEAFPWIDKDTQTVAIHPTSAEEFVTMR